MGSQVMGYRVVQGGSLDCFQEARSFSPQTNFKVSNHQFCKNASCGVLQRSAGKGSWRFCNSPSLRLLTECKARGREQDTFREGRCGSQVRASKSHDDKGNHYEIRVCTNRSCRQLGSLQTLDVLRSLAPHNVAVESCGCLRKCGSGPNLVILHSELVVSHCSTAVHAARLLELQCGATDPDTNLKALGLKERGNKLFEIGQLQEAEQFYSEAIELNPSGGLHLIYGNRSALRLAKGDSPGALDDADQAMSIAPMWAGAYLRKADAFLQMGDFENAQLSCDSALQLDTSLRRSKAFQTKVKEIAESLDLVRFKA